MKPNSPNKRLLILGCSDTKRASDGLLPALDRYDGPAYRVVRNFLRTNYWPEDLSIAALSARYGLFGVLKGIENYNERMNPTSAKAKSLECSTVLLKWAPSHQSVHLSLGKDYMPALEPALKSLDIGLELFEGRIGEKLNRIKTFLSDTPTQSRIKAELEGGTGRFRYFLPDWDDLLDPQFDFENDSFSGTSREERGDKHCCALLQSRMSDGILVSLAQQGKQKGPLRRLRGTETAALSPQLRNHFALSRSQYLFGDCGAFSYLNEENPAIEVDQAVALYESYGFDLGASVDHIPVNSIIRNGEQHNLTPRERQERIDITVKNARAFIECARMRKAQFTPVGAIQARTPEEFAQTVIKYYDFGYRHLAIGGLVPLKDSYIEEVVKAVAQAAESLPRRPWIHLFGIFRPKLQSLFRELRIDSFDSASYFRKAWLRSDQNYLASDGKWYAAIRVPMTSDGRTRQRLTKLEADIEQLQLEESNVLRLLTLYDKEQAGINEVIDAVMEYDRHLARSSETEPMREKYRRTLLNRPWQLCDCNFCKGLGVHMLVFRGANRNKRRGAHNTLMLYGNISQGSYIDHNKSLP